MEILFWCCLAGLAWAYFGYPSAMLARAALRKGQAPSQSTGDELPTVTVILAVRNAAEELSERVGNLLGQEYPAELLDVLIICNGCTDGSEQVAAEIVGINDRVDCLTTPSREGKAGALNAGAEAATGEVLVFADARQRFTPVSIRNLVRPFTDARVGGVTGRLVVAPAGSPVLAGIGSYWELETGLRIAESRTGSVVGATGAIYAVRRELFRPLPPGVILDDVYLPLDIVRRGYRIDMAPDAIAYDRPSRDNAAEYRRRVRTLVGNYELLRLMPGLLSPVANPIFVRYVSHKLLRVLTPALCILTTLTGLLSPGLTYKVVAATLLALYALGALERFLPLRILALPAAFLLLHTAGLSAMARPFRRAADLWA